MIDKYLVCDWCAKISSHDISEGIGKCAESSPVGLQKDVFFLPTSLMQGPMPSTKEAFQDWLWLNHTDYMARIEVEH